MLDVIEKLNITVERDGDISFAEIHGSIRLKSFLHGAPDLKIMLNRDLFVGGTPPEYKKKGNYKNPLFISRPTFLYCWNDNCAIFVSVRYGK